MNSMNNPNIQEKKVNFLSLKCSTWARDSHGLYDFECQSAKTALILAKESGEIIRIKNEIRLGNKQEQFKDGERLLDIYNDAKFNSFTFINSVAENQPPTEKNIVDLQNKIWYIIRHDENPVNNTGNQEVKNKNEDYYLNKNDIIKLGRVKFALNEISINKKEDVMDVDLEQQGVYNISQNNYGTNPMFDFIYKSTTPGHNPHEEITCKYCFGPENDEENPLVDLCKCTGGIKYSHYNCVKQWMHTKLSRKENERKTVTSYNIKTFNCEICKTPYPCKKTFI